MEFNYYKPQNIDKHKHKFINIGFNNHNNKEYNLNHYTTGFHYKYNNNNRIKNDEIYFDIDNVKLKRIKNDIKKLQYEIEELNFLVHNNLEKQYKHYNNKNLII